MAGARKNTRRMHQLRSDFFEQGKVADAAGDSAADCWLCLEPIDYSADPGSTDTSHNLDHYFTVDARPDLQEDPDNFRHSHALCNQRRSNRSPAPGLGEVMPDWW